MSTDVRRCASTLRTKAKAREPLASCAHRACVDPAATTRKGGLRQRWGSRRSLGQRAGGFSFSARSSCASSGGYPKSGRVAAPPRQSLDEAVTDRIGHLPDLTTGLPVARMTSDGRATNSAACFRKHTQLAWQCFDLAVANKLNAMGNKHTAKARELSWQERKARQTQKLVDPRTDDKVATH